MNPLDHLLEAIRKIEYATREVWGCLFEGYAATLKETKFTPWVTWVIVIIAATFGHYLP